MSLTTYWMLSSSPFVELMVISLLLVETIAFVLVTEIRARASPSASDVFAARKLETEIVKGLNERPFANEKATGFATGEWLFVNETLSAPGSIKKEPPARSFVKPVSFTANLSLAKVRTFP